MDRRWLNVVSTAVETVSGIAIEGSATVSLANEPIVEDADRSNDAARIRVSVCSCKGSDGGVWGAPKKDSN